MSPSPKVQGLAIPKANPGTSFPWIINLLVTVLGPIMGLLTPMIRTELEKLVVKLYQHAESTPNPWDDFLAEFLLKILGLPVPPTGSSS